jgi:hypothetical protein
MPLFMIVERFRDVDAVGRRFRAQGRMLPDGVTVHASWIEPEGGRCFQIMEAARADELAPWMRRWADLVEFEVIPVLTSTEFWSSR